MRDDRSIQQRFEAFHAENPHVYARLEAMASEMHMRGRTRIGIDLLFNVLRWESLIQTTGDDFKLNDHYRSRYARLLLERHPEWEGLFQLRALTSP